MLRIAGFEGVWNHLYLPKTLSHSEVSHSTGCCMALGPLLFHGLHIVTSNLQLKDFFPKEDIYLTRRLSVFKAGHRANGWIETVMWVWITVENIEFSLLSPLGRDLLTERQVGVRVQVAGTSIVAISVTQLTARCYSAICAARGWRNNGS